MNVWDKGGVSDSGHLIGNLFPQRTDDQKLVIIIKSQNVFATSGYFMFWLSLGKYPRPNIIFVPIARSSPSLCAVVGSALLSTAAVL